MSKNYISKTTTSIGGRNSRETQETNMKTGQSQYYDARTGTYTTEPKSQGTHSTEFDTKTTTYGETKSQGTYGVTQYGETKQTPGKSGATQYSQGYGTQQQGTYAQQQQGTYAQQQQGTYAQQQQQQQQQATYAQQQLLLQQQQALQGSHGSGSQGNFDRVEDRANTQIDYQNLWEKEKISMRKEIDELKNQREVMKNQNEGYKFQYNELLLTNENLRKENHEMRLNKDTLKGQYENLNVQFENLKKDFHDVHTQKEYIKTQFEEKDRNLRELQLKFDDKINQCKIQFENLKKDFHDVQTQKEYIKTQFDEKDRNLRELQLKFEDFGNQIERVLLQNRITKNNQDIQLITSPALEPVHSPKPRIMSAPSPPPKISVVITSTSQIASEVVDEFKIFLSTFSDKLVLSNNEDGVNLLLSTAIAERVEQYFPQLDPNRCVPLAFQRVSATGSKPNPLPDPYGNLVVVHYGGSRGKLNFTLPQGENNLVEKIKKIQDNN